MKGVGALWRSRLPLLASLAGVILVDVALLVSYRAFYDTRVRALVDTQHTLETQRDELRARVEKLGEAEKRIESLREGLEEFFGETLGTRKERLVPLIDEIHQRTRKAGLVPKSIGYTEAQGAGDLDAIRMSFAVDGRYMDVKNLLSDFERSPRFLVVENLAVAPDAQDPGQLHAALTLAHYFRSADSRLGNRPHEKAEPEDAKKAALAKAAPRAPAIREASEKAGRSSAPPAPTRTPQPARPHRGNTPAAERAVMVPPAALEAPAAPSTAAAPAPAEEGASGPGMKQAPMRGLVIREGTRKKKAPQ